MVIEVGDAPRALKSETHSGLGGTRIFSPLKSSAVLIGLVLVQPFRARLVFLPLAPTQELGEALKRDVRQIERFRAVSAKLPYHQVLGVFPQNLRAGSFVRFTYRDSSGKDR